MKKIDILSSKKPLVPQNESIDTRSMPPFEQKLPNTEPIINSSQKDFLNVMREQIKKFFKNDTDHPFKFFGGNRQFVKILKSQYYFQTLNDCRFSLISVEGELARVVPFGSTFESAYAKAKNALKQERSLRKNN